VPSSDPVSWLLIERGWTVLSADGQEVGRVSEVTGDDRADIFDGLAFRPHSIRQARYVPAEHVGSITQGTVTLDLTMAEIARLGDFHEPPVQEQILPQRASLNQRIGSWLRGQRR
jgi:hypothetical protein